MNLINLNCHTTQYMFVLKQMSTTRKHYWLKRHYQYKTLKHLHCKVFNIILVCPVVSTKKIKIGTYFSFVHCIFHFYLNFPHVFIVKHETHNYKIICNFKIFDEYQFYINAYFQYHFYCSLRLIYKLRLSICYKSFLWNCSPCSRLTHCFALNLS